MERHAVYFEGVGYYADSQPHYKWSFTEDIKCAKLYKSEGYAVALIKRQKSCGYRDLISKIVHVDVKEMEIVNFKIDDGEIIKKEKPKKSKIKFYSDETVY